MSSESIRRSKFLSLILRHRPGEIGLTLDKNGWANVDELLEKMNLSSKNRTWEQISFDDLVEIVRTNDKKRFMVNEDETKIRACQGHSINVDLGLKPVTPPNILYHGTSDRFVESISKEGLKKGNRQYVHLSKDIETATKVGKRHGGNLHIYKINCLRMVFDAYPFYLSENGVWLVESVPFIYLDNV